MTKQENSWSREVLLIGDEGLAKIAAAKVLICGVGGVGSYVAEALARSAIGHIHLIDFDHYVVSNINRQLHAVHSTIGKNKITVVAERIKDINPECQVSITDAFISRENTADLLPSCDYIVDAIDSVPGKVALIKHAVANNVPVISAMGAGRRLDPTRLHCDDISQTKVCPLARVMRRELRKEGISSGVTVVYSDEPPCEQAGDSRDVIGSMVFVPAAMGIIMASHVVKEILAK